MQARAFSFPQLAPGDIAEYKVAKDIKGNVVGSFLYFQSDLPTRHVVFRLRPVADVDGLATLGFTHGFPQRELKRTPDGYNTIEMRDLPPVAVEPHMLPFNDVQMWMLFYRGRRAVKPEGFWRGVGTRAAQEANRLIQQSSQLAQAKAASLVAGASSDEEKLARLNDFCRQSIVNVAYFPAISDVDRNILQSATRAPDDLLKSGAGGNHDIPILFMAMARSLGFNAHLALASSWSDGAFKKDLLVSSYLSNTLVAVKLGDAWKFYDPRDYRVATGTLSAQNEANMALVASTNAIEWVKMPVTPAEKSQQKRTARFRIDEAGTLTGTVSIVYSGQALNSAISDYYKKLPRGNTALVSAREKSRIPSCEVSNVKILGSRDLAKPMKLTYEVKVPGYAERSGSRLFIQPAYFEKGMPNEFPDEKRVNDIFYQANTENVDDVTIEIPAGWQIEEGSAPVSKGGEDWGSWGYYTVSLGYKKSDNTIVYKRDFLFRPSLVAAAKYKLVKGMFDHAFAQDAHMITLKGAGAGPDGAAQEVQ